MGRTVYVFRAVNKKTKHIYDQQIAPVAMDTYTNLHVSANVCSHPQGVSIMKNLYTALLYSVITCKWQQTVRTSRYSVI
jgi:hypothetical protein